MGMIWLTKMDNLNLQSISNQIKPFGISTMEALIEVLLFERSPMGYSNA